jgi:hypothetical protein
LLDSDAYFVAEDGPIAVLLSLTAEPLALPPLDGSMLTITLMSNLGRYELPHRPMIECFLRRRGARPSDDQGALDALLPSGEHVRIIFDELERCASVERPDVVIVTGALKLTREGRLAGSSASLPDSDRRQGARGHRAGRHRDCRVAGRYPLRNGADRLDDQP